MAIDAARLHRESLVIDSHNDTAVTLIRQGDLDLEGRPRNDRAGFVAHLRKRLPAGTQGPQLTLTLLRESGIDVAFFAVDNTAAWGNHLLYVMDAHGYLLREIHDHDHWIRVVRSCAEIDANREEGRLGALLTVENSEALEGSLYVLDALYELGIRSLTLTHSARTRAGDGCEVEGGGGLTAFGRQVVRRMEDLGMLVDVSHLNDRGFEDVLDVASRPVIASHSCCRAVCGDLRNLTDGQLRRLGETGGVVGITYVPWFIDTEDPPTLARLVDHILHALEVAGEDAVGLGSDFDGGGDLFADASQVPSITEELLRRGVGEAVVVKVLGGNHRRLLETTVG